MLLVSFVLLLSLFVGGRGDAGVTSSNVISHKQLGSPPKKHNYNNNIFEHATNNAK